MNGIVVIDKPADFTSFDVVAVVRRTLHEKKVGHCGTLDPMATGILPVLLGRAAKAQSLLPETDKQYTASFHLGMTTDTLDITGTVLSKTECDISGEEIKAVLPSFRGDIMQTPPMYSAKSVGGVRLYDLARQGVEVERRAVPVTISELTLLDFDRAAQSGSLRVSCSKGTYIRVICDDIGKALGCGCVMTALRRTAACGYGEGDAVTLDRLKELAEKGEAESVIRPTDSVFLCYPGIRVSEAQQRRFCNGGGLALERLRGIKAPEDGRTYRIYGADGLFLGLGFINAEKQELSIKKLFTDKEE